MKKVIFVHGYTSTPLKIKYQIIAAELKKLKIPFAMPQLPGGEHPQSKEWTKIIEREVKAATLPIILFGHSLGTRAVLLYLDQYKHKVDTVILVSAFNNNIAENRERKGGNYNSFWNHPVDIPKIKTLARKFVVVHSKDDASIAYEQGVDIAHDLGAELITYEKMGHFSGNERAEKIAAEWIKVLKRYL